MKVAETRISRWTLRCRIELEMNAGKDEVKPENAE